MKPRPANAGHGRAGIGIGPEKSLVFLSLPEDTQFRHPRRSEGGARARRGSNMRSAEGSVFIWCLRRVLCWIPERAHDVREFEDDGPFGFYIFQFLHRLLRGMT